MKSFAQALDLQNDPILIDAYRAHHRHVWPEVVAALRALGIERMKIWMLGTRLFMWFEAPDDFDPRRDFQRYTDDPRCRAWDDWMRTLQRRIEGGGDPQAWWSPMEEVFDLESC